MAQAALDQSGPGRRGTPFAIAGLGFQGGPHSFTFNSEVFIYFPSIFVDIRHYLSLRDTT